MTASVASVKFLKFEVDHATIQRWVYKFTPLIEATFWKIRKTVGNSWRMDETYIKVKGEWMCLYRAVGGNIVDLLRSSDA